jgi:hypothetical protein
MTTARGGVVDPMLMVLNRVAHDGVYPLEVTTRHGSHISNRPEVLQSERRLYFILRSTVPNFGRFMQGGLVFFL